MVLAAAHLASGWYNRLAWAGIAIAVVFVLSRLSRWWIARLALQDAGESRQLTRLRRRETAVYMLSTALRYVFFLAAAFAVFGIFVHDTLAALGGATFVMIVVAFGFQRLLFDVVAGFLVLFEGWYGVGDFVTLKPMEVSGFVEEFGLRTTVLRSLNGDRMYVPNGQVIAATRSPLGFRRYSIELLTRNPERVRQAVQDAARRQVSGEARFLRPPYIAEEREVADRVWLVRAQCDVPPTMEWLAESLLRSRLQADLGDDLLADPVVYTLDAAALSRYERRVLIG
jgi:small conductance mechanosensitive channel